MDAFLSAQFDGDAPDDEGEFSIDLLAMREKMGLHSFQMGSQYLLKLVQAGVGSSSQCIEITLKAGEVRVHFQNPDPAIVDLVELRASLRNPHRLPNGPRKDLALGIFGAFAQQAVGLDCSTNSHVLRISPGQEKLQDERAATGKRFFELVVTRKGPSNEGGSREDNLLTERCWHCPVPVFLNGATISGKGLGPKLFQRHVKDGPKLLSVQPPRAYVTLEAGKVPRESTFHNVNRETLLYECKVSGPTWMASMDDCCSTAVALDWNFDKKAEIRFYQKGVLLESHSLARALQGVILLADADGLSTDLSGFKLIRDAAYDARILLAEQQIASAAQAALAGMEEVDALLLREDRQLRKRSRAWMGLMGCLGGGIAGGMTATPLFLPGAVLGGVMGTLVVASEKVYYTPQWLKKKYFDRYRADLRRAMGWAGLAPASEG